MRYRVTLSADLLEGNQLEESGAKRPTIGCLIIVTLAEDFWRHVYRGLEREDSWSAIVLIKSSDFSFDLPRTTLLQTRSGRFLLPNRGHRDGRHLLRLRKLR